MAEDGHSELGFAASLLYPFRNAEGLAMIATMATAFWVFTILVPEYCLGVWEDSNSLGTPSMGGLIVLISTIPALLLLPLILTYTLQYLGRVLASSAMGEAVPPRTPDRNFDGLFSGLGPWLVWMVLGVSASGLPLCCAILFTDRPLLANTWTTFGLVMLGLPYAEVALMICFLHDEPLTATPIRVVGELVGHGNLLLPMALKGAAILGLAVVTFAMVLKLRGEHFWLYLVAALGCWAILIWAAVATMRVMGACYFFHRYTLKWRHGRSGRGMA
jgi:hypothetical protein